MNHYLFKSEPNDYSIDDLEKDKQTMWDGIRNYQARNFMRDEMQVGDRILFYHSNHKPPHVAGVAKVVSRPYPDPTQFDENSKYYDPKSTPEKPRWVLVDVAFVKKAKRILTLAEVKADPRLEGIKLAQKGQRLSIQPVSEVHFEYIEKRIDRS